MTHTKTTGIPLTNRLDKMTREPAKRAIANGGAWIAYLNEHGADGAEVPRVEHAVTPHPRTVTEFTPQQVKAPVCGHGGVDKAVVKKFVERLTGVPVKNAHAADSVAVAIAGHLRID